MATFRDNDEEAGPRASEENVTHSPQKLLHKAYAGLGLRPAARWTCEPCTLAGEHVALSG